MVKKVVVIGGGAAGMMAAGQAAFVGAEVVLLEKMTRLGSKIAISGKGRCNLTNAGDISNFVSFYPGNGKFLYASLKEFSNKALVYFFQDYGVETKVERGGRVFPTADDSEVIVEALKKYLKRTRVKIRLNQAVQKIMIEEGKVTGVQLAVSGEVIQADAVIVATGGASYPGTGSTGDGYTLAENAGHRIIKPLPALVPLKTLEKWPKELQGLTLKNTAASIWVDGKKQGEEFGEMLFTHFGVSGPIILTLSRIASKALDQKQKVELKIDLKPALTSEQIDLRLQRDFLKYGNKQFKNALDDLLPQSMIPVMVALSEVDPEKVVNKVTKEERRRLGRLFQELVLHITATLGMATAIVTSGGVDAKQINPATMESRLVKGLYFAGEVIDIDGVTGGYNLQAAFSTGYKAGKATARMS
ncbi:MULTISPECIES: NAD(P)/FAD-dependent oxidoreductase [unclassified Dehalobacter]|uniref:NAD(P)/FAD-dependent oxidoreductase n=1 Tax=unclassified Dehalobacter TaxID=2635733 RepID=UPI000E6C8398|nr:MULTISPECIES: NAD(P)/FAD-dependent oxidoreductase [unclassified Dehalobacter]RJE46939.1 FAD-dependent oxidoreductase [Dehalobacter sp. MCB1]TCX50863.1 aminoacetone oxidase family FAD-binding enzyme [Dehalobacter sp. 12DCB1]TCX51575.1 aminoacetone oxidase family FAD-binding enzyme [Dehalobacter sp. 14DCB1]